MCGDHACGKLWTARRPLQPLQTTSARAAALPELPVRCGQPLRTVQFDQCIKHPWVSRGKPASPRWNWARLAGAVACPMVVRCVVADTMAKRISSHRQA